MFLPYGQLAVSSYYQWLPTTAYPMLWDTYLQNQGMEGYMLLSATGELEIITILSTYITITKVDLSVTKDI